MAEELAKLQSTEKSPIRLDITDAEDILSNIVEIGNVVRTWGSGNKSKTSTKVLHDAYNKVAVSVRPMFRQVNKEADIEDVSKAIASSRPRCILSLDDAVTVLRSLAQTSPKVELAVIKAQIDNTVEQKFRSLFTNQMNGQVGLNLKPTSNVNRMSRKAPKRKIDYPVTGPN